VACDRQFSVCFPGLFTFVTLQILYSLPPTSRVLSATPHAIPVPPQTPYTQPLLPVAAFATGDPGMQSKPRKRGGKRATSKETQTVYPGSYPPRQLPGESSWWVGDPNAAGVVVIVGIRTVIYKIMTCGTGKVGDANRFFTALVSLG
jgi:hypothetical protein